MPRSARIDFPGARHHVMNRGARQSNVLFNEDHCSQFLLLLEQATERYGIRIHGFAIMPNHFHLMLESVEGNLGETMKYVTSQYGYYLNRDMEWDGPVFRGRYKSKLVYLEEHWIYLLAYLHLNPVRARLVGKPEEALWTSHPVYLGRTRGFEWMETGVMSEYFNATGGYRGFVKEVRSKRAPVPEGFGGVTFDTRQSARMMVTKQVSTEPRMAVEVALSEVQGVAGCSREELYETRRGRAGNVPRALAVWWLIHGAGLSNVEAGKTLGLTPNAVSKILKKIRDNSNAYGNGELSSWITRIKEQ